MVVANFKSNYYAETVEIKNVEIGQTGEFNVKAGKEIVIKPNFHAVAGSDLHLSIKPELLGSK